jgi:hypothetical protein
LIKTGFTIEKGRFLQEFVLFACFSSESVGQETGKLPQKDAK